MADSNYFDVLSSSDQIRANHEKYKDKYVNSTTNGIDSETFLKLLVAEMSNQDPLEPTSNTEFISQLAQFSSMQYMQDTSKYALANYASSLVGKTVTATKVEGTDVVSVTGEVTKVHTNKEGVYIVTIGKEEFTIDKISSVQVAETKKEEDDNKEEDPSAIAPSALGDSIARAAAMVGMYATVKIDDKTLDQGFVEAIQVQDGKINVIVNGKSRPVESILELMWATVVEDPEDPTETDGSDNTEVTGNGDEVSDTAVGTTDFDKGAQDVPDLESLADLPEDEQLEQLQNIINSMM